MITAAAWALGNNAVAVAPCSGFHHAGYYEGEGFCTFNGLMVTAKALLHSGLVERVGILDFDQHYGNGTDDIIRTLNAGAWIKHYTAGAHYHSPDQAEKFLDDIPDILAHMHDCDVILYQAGADPHIDDPFGGWLTIEQLAERDRIVFEACHNLDIPVAWNLAGGYQSPLRKVLDIHDNTMKACWNVFGQHD
jgi:acetoin utilization deacetylase AcuC-like enzyme